jgi:hypothetical protein
MKAVYLLGVGAGIGLGLILACLLIDFGMFPTTAGNRLNAVLYCGAILTNWYGNRSGHILLATSRLNSSRSEPLPTPGIQRTTSRWPSQVQCCTL